MISALDLKNSLGFATHMGRSQYNDLATIRARLAELDAPFIRDLDLNSQARAAYADLFNDGVKLLFTLDANSGSAPRNDADPYWTNPNNGDRNLEDLIALFGEANIVGFTGPNEPNLFVRGTQRRRDGDPIITSATEIAYINEFLTDARAELSALGSALPLYGASWTERGMFEDQGDAVKDVIDGPDGHAYWGNLNPETVGQFGADGTGGEGEGYRRWLLNKIDGDIIFTESGYSTGGTANDRYMTEEGQAKYWLRHWLGALARGVRFVTKYEFKDSHDLPSTNEEHGFGVVTKSYKRKTSFNTLKSFRTLTRDTSQPADMTPIDIELSGDLDKVRHLLVKHSDGGYFLHLWVGEQSYQTNSARTPISVSERTVTVALPEESYYQLYKGNFDTPVERGTSSTITLDVPDVVTTLHIPGPVTGEYETNAPSAFDQSQMGAGETLVIEPGIYNEILTVTQPNITIKARGDVTLDGLTIASQVDGVQVQNIVFDGSSQSSTDFEHGVVQLLGGNDDCAFTLCVAKNGPQNGFFGNKGPSNARLVMTRCESFDNGRRGMTSYGPNHLIQSCYLHDNRIDGLLILFDNGVLRDSRLNHNGRVNGVYQTYAENGNPVHGIYMYDFQARVHDWLILNNDFEGNRDSACRMGGDDNVFQHNRVSDSDYGMFIVNETSADTCLRNQVLDNVFSDQSSRFTAFGDFIQALGAQDILVEDNVHSYGNLRLQAGAGQNSSGTYRNNDATESPGNAMIILGDANQTLTSENNTYRTNDPDAQLFNGQTFAAWQAAGNDTGSVRVAA